MSRPGDTTGSGRRSALGLVAVALLWLFQPVEPAGAAPPVADAGGPYAIAEGDELALDASASSDADGDPLTFRWDLDGDGRFGDAVGETPTVPWSVLIARGIGDDGSLPISVEVSDGSGTSTAGGTVVIANTAPTIHVDGPAIVAAGRATWIELYADDPGLDTPSQWRIDWGDGTVQTVDGDTARASHVYTAAGPLRGVQVSVTDEDGTWHDGELVVPYFDAADKIRSHDVDTSASSPPFGASPLDSAYGVAFGPDGSVLVSGFVSDTVERYHPDTGAHLGTFVAAGSGGLSGPKGLVIGPDGDLLVASSGTSSILRYDGDSGAFLGAFVPAGSGGLASPAGLAYGSDGHLYVADQGPDDILRFDGATGASLGTFAFLQVNSDPAGVAWGPDGHLYVAINGRNRVDRRDGATGADIGTLGAGLLSGPTGVAFGPDGALWISDYGVEQIVRWDWQNDLSLGVWHTEPIPAGPMLPAFRPDHQFLVVDEWTVNSTGDAADVAPGDGACDTGGLNSQGAPACTLRAALTEMQAQGVPAAIGFGLPVSEPGYDGGSGTWSIAPSTTLPVPSVSYTIDGGTQPGYAGAPLVRLDGSASAASALQLDAVRSAVLGLSITGFGGIGILLQQPDAVVADTYLGLTPDGLAVDGLGTGGLLVTGADSLISGNTIVGNGFDGVLVQTGGDGAMFLDNRIGVEATGFIAAPNGQNGIQANGVVGLVVGRPGRGNVISANSNNGLHFLNVDGSTVQGNLIGLAADGSTIRGNGGQGLLIQNGSTDLVVGGSGPGEANAIAGNAGAGVRIQDDDGVDLRGTTFRDNTGVGIALDFTSPRPNDPGDTDGGANQGQNHPVITDARIAGNDLEIDLDLDTTAGTYVVDAYLSASPDPSGSGEGGRWIGSAAVQTAGTGPVIATVDLGTVIGLGGQHLTLTATSPGGDTSEFSPAFALPAAPTNVVVVNTTADGADAFPGDGLCSTGGLNVAGNPACTLRAALQEATASAGIDTVHFAVPVLDGGHAGGIWTIQPLSPLPAVTAGVTVDGSTQAASATPVIELDGSSLGSGPGLSVTGADAVVRGLAVHAAPGSGIEVDGARVTIEGNHLGTDAAGLAARPNGQRGLTVNAADVVVRGNLISGNTLDGVVVTVTGERALFVENLVGTDVTGNAALPNLGEGIQLEGAIDVVVGRPGEANVLSGNAYAGINGWTGSPSGATVQANLIGVGLDGATLVPNSGVAGEGGITVRTSAGPWLIGGTTPGEGNVIAGNHGGGVVLEAINGNPDEIAVVGNEIRANDGPGIDLGGDGVTANDPGDGDIGPNDRLNFPVLTSVTEALGVVDVDVDLDAPAGDYRIELFDDTVVDPSGYGEGAALVHAFDVTHGGTGPESFSTTFAGTPTALSATATEDLGARFGSTSEFSLTWVMAAGTVVVNDTGDASDLTPGDGVCDTGALNADGDPACTLRAAIEEAEAGPVDTVHLALTATDANHDPGGWWTIPVPAALPTLTQPLTIDATTQPGWAGEPLMLLSDTGTTTSGLDVDAADSTVRGFAFVGFTNGIAVSGARAVLQANWFGIRPDGSVGSNAQGVQIWAGGTDTLIGGTGVDDGNVVVGSSNAGVRSYADGVRLEGNLVGRSAAGALVRNSVGVDVVAGSGVSIGGTAPGAGNVITGQTYAPAREGIGVRVGSSADDVAVLGNEIHTNVRNLDLGGDGATPNDPLDADVGANQLLNHPDLTITSSTTADSITWDVDLDVTLDVPAGDYRVEFFANTLPGVGGSGAAEQLVHATTINHPGGGAATYPVSYSGPEPTFLSSTATEDLGATFGATSELSPVVGLTAATFTVNSTGDADDLDPADGVCDTGAVNSAGVTECTLRAALTQADVSVTPTVRFDLPVSDPGHQADGWWDIAVGADLPRLLADGLTVDGATQTGYDGSRPLVSVRDDLLGGDLFVTVGDDVTIRALSLGNPGDDVIQVEGDRTTIVDSWIGLDPEENDLGGPGTQREGVIVYSGFVDTAIVDSRVHGFDSGVVSNSGTVDVTISGTEIFGNRNGGVVFDNQGTVSLLGNSIHDNTGLGFDLGTDTAVTANDPGDADGGANGLLNFPVLQSAVVGVGTVDVTYELDVPAGDYRIEFFENTGTDESGHGEGERFAGVDLVNHPGGSASYVATISGGVGSNLSATTTEDLGGGSYGGTSEFSASFVVAAVTVNSTGNASDAVAGDGVCDTGGLNSAGDPECTLRAAIEESNASAVIDAIAFHLPVTEAGYDPGGWWTISPTASLPDLTDTVHLDARTQPGWTGRPLIEIDGSSTTTQIGLQLLGATDSLIAGFSIGDYQRPLGVQGNRNRIEDNWVGVRADGVSTWATPPESGIRMVNSAGDGIVGGPGHGNVVVDATVAGVYVWVSGGVRIQGNTIGLLPDGVTPQPNAVGVQFGNSSADTEIGGTAPGEGNVISGNTGAGVELLGASDARNPILGNRIWGNGGLGIDLEGDGVTANDAGDADTGANARLNFPVITGLVDGGAGTVDAGYDLDVPAGDYRIEVFVNPSGADPSGHGEGEQLVAVDNVTHTGSGAEAFTLSFPGAVGDVISMTATPLVAGTDLRGTSEFSAAGVVAAPILVNSTGDAADATPGDGSCDTGGTNSEGDPECTLRAAIQESAAGLADVVGFDLPVSDPGHAAGAWTIQPAASALPTVGTGVRIDATTQPGWAGDPVVQLDGALRAGPDDDGLTLGDGGSVLGLSVTNWPDDGIQTDGSEVSVRSSWLGIDPAGVTAPNGESDVSVWGSATAVTIGGTGAGEGNRFAAGGTGDGVLVVDSASDVAVVGNVFGLLPDGATPSGAPAEAVTVTDTTSDVRIEANRFAHLPEAAIVQFDAATGIVVVDNVFGLDELGGTASTGSAVWTGASGTLRFGGVLPSEGNLVRHQLYHGVMVDPATTGTITILGNSIEGTGGLGIDLGTTGVTANDPGDGDAGPNGLLNFPVVVGASESGGVVTAAIDLDVPAGDYRIEAFANPSGADPSGHGEGEVFLGAASVTHTGAGVERFTVTFPGAAGDVIALTTTQDLGAGSFGATSEFGPVATVVAGTAVTVTERSVSRSDPSALGGLDPAAPAAGVVGPGVALDGGTERLVAPPVTLGGALTASGWVRLDTATADARVVAKGETELDVAFEVLVEAGTQQAVARLDVGGGPIELRGNGVPLGAWQHLALTWDGATATLHQDGVATDSAAVSGLLPPSAAAPLVVGNLGDGTSGLDGTVDQVEVVGTARSADWLATVVAAHANPSTVTVGAPQNGAPQPWTAAGGARTGAFALAAPETVDGADAWATVTGVDEPGLEFESWWLVSDASTSDVAAGTRTGNLPIVTNEAALGPAGWDLATWNVNGRTVDAPAAGGLPVGWVHVIVRTDETGTTTVLVDGVPVNGPVAQALAAASGSAGLRVGELGVGETWLVDDVRLRRLVSDEPTTSLGPLDLP